MTATDTQHNTRLESLQGRMLDLDSHLMIPMDRFAPAFGTFGRVVGPVAKALIQRFSKDAEKWAAEQHEVPVTA